jgi:integrase
VSALARPCAFAREQPSQPQHPQRRIKKELGTLRTALHLAQEQGRFDGRPDLAVPASFDPDAPTSDRSPTREEWLKLLPELASDPAAIAAFVLATSAEWSALERATRGALPKDLKAARVEVPVRGSKTDDRDRVVPIVTDEQRLLMRFVAQHAGGGDDGPLFPSLANFRRALGEACERAGVEHVSPHSLRHAAGQWLVDLGTPIELVSRILGHASTSITESVYARVKAETVGDRMLDTLDPRYTRSASQARQKSDRAVKTLTKLPSPRVEVLYEVDGVTRNLADWCRATGIPKGTLHHRVVTRGLPMADAVALGHGTRGKSLEGVSRVRNPRETPAKRGEDCGTWGTLRAHPESDNGPKTPSENGPKGHSLRNCAQTTTGRSRDP